MMFWWHILRGYTIVLKAWIRTWVFSCLLLVSTSPQCFLSVFVSHRYWHTFHILILDIPIRFIKDGERRRRANERFTEWKLEDSGWCGPWHLRQSSMTVDSLSTRCRWMSFEAWWMFSDVDVPRNLPFALFYHHQLQKLVIESVKLCQIFWNRKAEFK